MRISNYKVLVVLSNWFITMLLAVQRLVRLTITHFQYPTNYLFPSYAEVCVSIKLVLASPAYDIIIYLFCIAKQDWFVTELGKKKSKVMKSTRMLAIDCEMVTCDDGTEAVVRVGAVDRDLKVCSFRAFNLNTLLSGFVTVLLFLSDVHQLGGS